MLGYEPVKQYFYETTLRSHLTATWKNTRDAIAPYVLARYNECNRSVRYPPLNERARAAAQSMPCVNGFGVYTALQLILEGVPP